MGLVRRLLLTPMIMSIGLEQAVEKAHDFFRKQCGARALTHWEIVSSVEDIAKGAYVIVCRERCFLDSHIRGQEIWIDSESGEVDHTRRIKAHDGPKTLPE